MPYHVSIGLAEAPKGCEAMIAKEQSFGAGEPFPGAAANAAIVVPDTRNFMAQFVPLIDVVLIAIAVHETRRH